MDVEFVVPYNFEDLCSISSTQYVVREVSSVREISFDIRKLPEALQLDGIESIAEKFDSYYSTIKHFNDLEPESVHTAYDTLLEASELLTSELRSYFDDAANSNQFGARFKYRNLLKMIVYLLCQFSELFEAQDTKSVAIVAKKGRKKKPSESESSWNLKRGEFMRFIDQVYRLPIHKLWEPPIVESEFINLVIKCLFKFLENENIVREKTFNNDIIHFLGFAMKTFGSSNLGYNLKMIEVVQNSSRSVPVLSEAVNLLITEYEIKNVMSELYKEVCCLEFESIGNETTRMHSLAQFLMEVSEKCWQEALTSINVLLPCLEEDSHIIRNCVLSIIGVLVKKISLIDDAADELIDLRDKLLQLLLNHICDLNCFVRSKCLSISAQLIEAEALPLNLQLHFLEAGVGRLKDKTSNTRKNSLSFLKSFLIMNPYIAKISLSELTKSFEKENEKLAGMLPSYMKTAVKNAINFDSSDEEEEAEEPSPNGVDKDHGDVQNGPDGNNDPAQDAGPEAESENGEEKGQDENPSDPVLMQHMLVDNLKRVMEFSKCISSALPSICVLLQSATITDVIEAIDFFTVALRCGMMDAVIGVKAMMNLVFSKQQSIKDAVVAAYKKIYLINDEEGKDRLDASQVAQNLVLFLNGAAVNEITSIAEFVKAFVKSKDITEDVVTELWDKFALKSSSTSDNESLCSIMLLTMIASVDQDIMFKRLNLLVQEGLGPRAKNSFQFAKVVCMAISQISGTKGRFPDNHVMFANIKLLLTSGVTNGKDNQWVPMANNAVALLYQLADHPEKITKEIIIDIAQIIMNLSSAEKDVKMVFCRFLFLCGHCAFWSVRYLENDVSNELKRRAAHKHKSLRLSLSMHKSSRSASASKISEDAEENPENDVEDIIVQFIGKICDREMLDEENMFSLIYPVVTETCKWCLKNFDSNICAAAYLSLMKFMTISSQICEENLQKLITMMQKCSDLNVRSNIVIGLADLVVRFPNDVEPWTPHLYSMLTDGSAMVRKNTITILSVLIKHDQIKVKGYISKIALCIIDSEEEISSATKCLFQELSIKGNSLYNVLPDLISALSDPASNLSEADYKTIIRFVFQFISKDHQVEGLVQKLCSRLKDASSPSQVHKIAFSLTLLKFNKHCVRIFLDKKTCYVGHLDDGVFVKYLQEVVANSKTSCPELVCEIDAFVKEMKL